MNDQKKIEWLARKAMGWKPKTDEWEKVVWKNWKPLSDWNHTMEVLDAVSRKTGDFLLIRMKGRPFVCHFIDGAKCVRSASGHRAICKAAFLALSA